MCKILLSFGFATVRYQQMNAGGRSGGKMQFYIIGFIDTRCLYQKDDHSANTYNRDTGRRRRRK